MESLGNPIALAAMTDKGNRNTAIKWVGGALAFGAGAYGVYKLVAYFKNAKEQKESRELLTDINKVLATRIYNALNPNILKKGWVDQDALYAIAPQITNWQVVSNSYETTYSRNLTKDLQAALDADELELFLSMAKRATDSQDKRAGGFVPTRYGKYKFYGSTKRGTVTFKKGDILSANATVNVTPAINDWPTGKPQKLTGKYTLNQIAQVTLDKDKNVYTIFNVTGAGGKFWVHNSAFNLSLNGLTVINGM